MSEHSDANERSHIDSCQREIERMERSLPPIPVRTYLEQTMLDRETKPLNAEIERQRTRISELEAELEQSCEHCGARVYSGPPDCPRCAAPQCCPQCCKIDTLSRRITELEAERDRLRGLIDEHNNECVRRCGEGEQEGVRCGYRPYFPRRCPECPRHEMIEVAALEGE